MRYRRGPTSGFSDRSVRPSFFLTAPARNPRTLCCCQPVTACSSSMRRTFLSAEQVEASLLLGLFPAGRCGLCCECQWQLFLAFAVSAPSLFRFFSSHLIGAGAWPARLRQSSSRLQDMICPLGGLPFEQLRLMPSAPTTQSPAVEARRSWPLAPCLLGHRRRQHGRSLRERSPVLCATFGQARQSPEIDAHQGS